MVQLDISLTCFLDTIARILEAMASIPRIHDRFACKKLEEFHDDYCSRCWLSAWRIAQAILAIGKGSEGSTT